MNGGGSGSGSGEKTYRLLGAGVFFFAGLILARTGVVDTSLRELATQLGTSARMLVYYFGSKEQLILEILTRQQRAAIPQTEELDLPSSLAAHREWCFEDWHECTRGERHNNRIKRLIARLSESRSRTLG